jgi:hypothetical protein
MGGSLETEIADARALDAFVVDLNYNAQEFTGERMQNYS